MRVMRADETTNFATYHLLYFWYTRIYVATIHNATKETSSEEYVSTIEQEL